MLRSFARHQGVTCGAGARSGGGCSTVSVELIVAAVSTLSRRANSFCTTTKNTGTMIKASTTTAIMPPITPGPKAKVRSLDRSLDQRFALGAEVLREFDDQNGVFGGETDDGDKPDGEVDV